MSWRAWSPVTTGCLRSSPGWTLSAAQQLQLYGDQLERFSVVSTMLSGGQALPIYQDPVREIAGVLRGAVTRQRFACAEHRPPSRLPG